MSKNLKKEPKPAVKVEYYKPPEGPDLSGHISSLENDCYRSRPDIDSDTVGETNDEDSVVGKSHLDALWEGRN